ncbi:MAG: ZIP family metal transporter [Myxococcaceae bacterium]
MNVSVLPWILGAAVLAGVGSAVLAGVVLMLPKERRAKALPWLVAFSAGALLGAAFGDLLPQALTGASAKAVSLWVLGGMMAFMLLELLLAHRHGHGHAHGHEHEEHSALGPLVLFGDALHNFVDGVAIAAAFSVSKEAGIGTAVAVLAHEVPQEVGNVALLLEAGYSPAKAFGFNVLSNSVAVVGALAAGLVLDKIQPVIPYVLAVACAGFIYVAAADLIPGIREEAKGSRLLQAALLIAGAAAIVVLQLG